MYAKVFAQIFDSSIAEDWQVRHVFTDLLTLADVNGVVDMTREAIARRTNTPLEIVERGIAELAKPDTKSRNAAHQGRRIVRLDKHRDWGWLIVNHAHYRAVASEDQRRAKTAERVRRFKAKRKGNAPVTLGNAGNASQSQSQSQMQKSESESGAETLTKTGAGAPSQSSRPDSVMFVVDAALRQGGYKAADVEGWVMSVDWSQPSAKILADAAAEFEDPSPVNLALRFVRFNNSKGWKVKSWKAALKGFNEASANTGASDVPMDWVPRIESTPADGGLRD
ncbi:MAG: hypothetical protein IH623_00160 [Verrucomicrobia bacterium]|nr:hypothetical protein [Verrucomicrobiota bacterium]